MAILILTVGIKNLTMDRMEYHMAQATEDLLVDLTHRVEVMAMEIMEITDMEDPEALHVEVMAMGIMEGPEALHVEVMATETTEITDMEDPEAIQVEDMEAP
jgi:hypothetical protein